MRLLGRDRSRRRRRADWAGLKKSGRVAGFVHGANAVELEDGAFGEWLVAMPGW